MENNTTKDLTMLEEEIGLMDVLDELIGGIDIILTLVQMFSPQEDELSDILALVIEEISDIFKLELSEEDLQNAIANLQTVQNYININYTNEVNSGLENEDLFNALGTNDSQSVATSLINYSHVIIGWVNQFYQSSENAQLTIACQGLSYSLTAYFYIFNIYKESARIYWDAEPGKVQDGIQAQWTTAQGYAKLAVDTLTVNPIKDDPRPGLLQSFLQSRQNQTALKNNMAGPVFEDYYLGVTGMQGLPLSWKYDPNVYNTFFECYKNLLASANPTSIAQFQSSLQALLPWVQGSDEGGTTPQDNIDSFSSAVLPGLTGFGNWYSNAQNSINFFTYISTATNPYAGFHGVAAIGNTLYLTSRTNDGLYKLDIGSGVGRIPIISTAGLSLRGIIAIGNVLYMTADGPMGIYTYDIIHDTIAQIPSTNELGFSELALYNNTLYLTAQGGGIWTFDLGVGVPSPISPPPYQFLGVAVSDGFVYLAANGNGGISKLDISSSPGTVPTQILTTADMGFQGIVVLNDILYLTGGNGIYSLDLSSTVAVPMQIESTDGFYFDGVVAAGNSLYLTNNGDTSVYAFDITTGASPTPVV